MNINSLVKAAIFSSTATGLGFAFMFVPNLEFISVTVFLSGFALGGNLGVLVGGATMIIYSGLNPLGSGLVHLPLFVSQILAMSVIGLVGGIARHILFKVQIRTSILISAIMGFVCTLWYDGITTLVYPISAGYDFNEALVFSISGLLFTFVHIISNTFIFAIVIPGYIQKMSN